MLIKNETCTSKIERALREAGDFLTVTAIAERSGCTSQQVFTTLHHFRQCQVADFVADLTGTWWFALPLESDTRMRHVDERVPEKAPRKRKPRNILQRNRA